MNSVRYRQRFGRGYAALILIVSLVLLGAASSQAEPERTHGANYKQAFKYTPEYLRQFVYDTAVNPNWIGKTDTFWYSFRTSAGTNYYRVNPKLASKEPLFDKVKLAGQLSEMLQKPLEPATLPLTRISVNDEGTKLKFVVADFQYEFDLVAEKLAKLGKAPPAPAQNFQGRRGGFGQRNQQQQQDQQQQQQQFQDQQQLQQQQEQQQFQDQQQQQQQLQEQQRQQDQQQQRQTGQRQGQRGQGQRGGGMRGGDYKAYAPDRKHYVFAQKHNLYLSEEGKEKEAVQITKDGIEDYSFGGGNDDRKARPFINWSPDSKAFYVTRADSRNVKELYLVHSLSEPRPTLEKYKYAMPGEEAVRKTELSVFHLPTKKLTPVKSKWKDESFTNLAWGKTCDELRFIRRDRLIRHIELCSYNPTTNQCNCLIVEGFENANIEFQPPRYLPETDELIWWSERSGWGHYYLCDRQGKLKNAITSGPFRASRIVSVDEKNRLLYFQGNAREPNENIYYPHLYCVHLDGTGLTLMDPGHAFHNSTLSTSRQFVVDNCSRVDMAPVSVLRDATGRQIMELEKADLSRLSEVGWKMPETFVVKASDGVTDLYGNMWKPFDFDPKKKYPIIAHVYPGPQQEGVSYTFSPVSPNQQLAQLGFVVVQVGHRGGSPGRSKAYASFGYNNLRDYGLADKKSAIEQLAARHSYIDLDRVGIYGHSGGGFMSAAALLQKPYNEFFKVAVASAGNHDNNVYNNTWSERYHGLKEVVIKKDDKAKEADKTASAQNATNQDADDEDAQQKDDKKVEEKKQEAAKQAVKTTEKKEQEKKDQEKKEVKKEVKDETKFEIKVPTNAELAANLKGHLLLVHGEVDNNVHPANTMRLVDALIKANKRFDMLILPGKRHAFGDYQPYFTQRMWDFFADHLLDQRQSSADILQKN